MQRLHRCNCFNGLLVLSCVNVIVHANDVARHARVMFVLLCMCNCSYHYSVPLLIPWLYNCLYNYSFHYFCHTWKYLLSNNFETYFLVMMKIRFGWIEKPTKSLRSNTPMLQDMELHNFLSYTYNYNLITFSFVSSS